MAVDNDSDESVNPLTMGAISTVPNHMLGAWGYGCSKDKLDTWKP